MANKMSITFKGFDVLAEKIDRIAGDIKPAVNEALTETQSFIQEQLKPTMPPHKRTGRTEASIIEKGKVAWSWSVAEIDTGFKISDGGFPSIFLMWGTPRMEKDIKIYNAMHGMGTRRKIRKLQMEIMEKHIALGKR